jgi:hypothetical protein
MGLRGLISWRHTQLWCSTMADAAMCGHVRSVARGMRIKDHHCRHVQAGRAPHAGVDALAARALMIRPAMRSSMVSACHAGGSLNTAFWKSMTIKARLMMFPLE